MEVTHVQKPAARFADQRECRHNRGLQRLLQLFFVRGLRGISVLQLLLHLDTKLRKTRLKAFITECLHFGFARVDGGDERLQFRDIALVLGADKPSDNAVEYLCCFHLGCRRLLTVTRTTFVRAAFLPQMQTIYCNWWDAEEPRKWRVWKWRVTRKRNGLKPGHYKRTGEEQPPRIEDQKASQDKIKIRTLKTVGAATRRSECRASERADSP